MGLRWRLNEDVSWPSYWWTRLTCNWFVVQLHCQVRGHDWRGDRYPRGHVACAWCGQCGGFRANFSCQPIRRPTPASPPDRTDSRE